MDHHKEEVISVIVPVYNAEHYLEECILSILHQTYHALQIILIDDGSTDHSGLICERFAETDNRITVIHQANAGVSAARNAGMQRAIGKYIIFTDSDDALPEKAYQDLLDARVENPDLVIGRMQCMDEDGKEVRAALDFDIQKIPTKIFAEELFAEKKFGYLGYLWDKLFVRSVIRENNLKFDPDIYLNEDRLFLIQYLLHCNFVSCCNNVVYFYRQRCGSVMNDTRHDKTISDKEMTVLNSFIRMETICRKYSDEVRSWYAAYWWGDMEDRLVSVIVPVYKVEFFLRRCVESILKQTYQNMEIILVDDGSPDRCPQICDSFCRKDTRIRVIHKKNGGLSDARNVGIEAAKGEYLCFVDSDDYIQSTMLEHLVKAVDSAGVNLAITNLKTVDEHGNRVFRVEQSPIMDGIFPAEELLPKLYQEMGWYYIVAWNKLYHRSLFEKLRFPVGKIHEDEYIVADVMWKAQKIACISSEEYIYTYQRKGSIMNEQQTQSHCDWLEALYLRFQFCSAIESLSELKRETRAVYFRELNHLFLDYKLKSGSTKKQRKTAKYQYKCMDGKSSTEKVNWVLFQISPYLEQRIVQFVRKIK